jgi:hypothetical protein
MAIAQNFTVTFDTGGYYTVDGLHNPSLTLTRGYTYTFTVNATDHPLWIQTTGHGYLITNQWSKGVSNAGTDSGVVTFTVPEDAPDTLYYQCQYHTPMYGLLSIVDAFNGGSFTTVDSYSPTIEDFVDKVFYGVKQNKQTGQAYIDTIAGDTAISLPSQYNTSTTDYVNWMWSYNRFLYSYDPTTGHLLMEVL